MARKNTYREDEVLETPFDYHHLLRAFVYIKKYLGKMILINLYQMLQLIFVAEVV